MYLIEPEGFSGSGRRTGTHDLPVDRILHAECPEEGCRGQWVEFACFESGLEAEGSTTEILGGKEHRQPRAATEATGPGDLSETDG